MGSYAEAAHRWVGAATSALLLQLEGLAHPAGRSRSRRRTQRWL
jgi:hypothetical protein